MYLQLFKKKISGVGTKKNILSAYKLFKYFILNGSMVLYLMSLHFEMENV